MPWYDPRTWRSAEPDSTRNAYKGARKTRRNADWRAEATSGNVALSPSLSTLRNRSRDLRRNNRYQRNSVFQLASYFSGLYPRSNIKAPLGASDAVKALVERKNAEIDARFEAWSRVCMAGSRAQFGGGQTQAVLGMVESGESFTRKLVRSLDRGLPVPLQIEILEADLVDHTINFAGSKVGALGIKLPEGSQIRQGVEFDSTGSRVAYYMHHEHPGETLLGRGGLERVRMPEDEIAHLMPIPFLRPGQVRGEPWNSAILQDLKDFEGYLEAERVRLYGSASVMGAVETDAEPSFDDDDEDDLPASGINPMRDASGNVVERLRAGTIAYLRKGQTWKSHVPQTTDGLDKYAKVDLRGMAAGAGMPYELFTGDLSDANFSALMAALGPFIRIATRIQREAVVPLWGAQVWGWFCEIGIESRTLPAEAGPVVWVAEPWPMVDPVKQTNASMAQVRAGAKPLARWQRELGEDPEQVRDEVAGEARWATENGIVLDSIATTSTLAGQAQDPKAANRNSALDPANSSK